jgi:hypothetical protein
MPNVSARCWRRIEVSRCTPGGRVLASGARLVQGLRAPRGGEPAGWTTTFALLPSPTPNPTHHSLLSTHPSGTSKRLSFTRSCLCFLSSVSSQSIPGVHDGAAVLTDFSDGETSGAPGRAGLTLPHFSHRTRPPAVEPPEGDHAGRPDGQQNLWSGNVRGRSAGVQKCVVVSLALRFCLHLVVVGWERERAPPASPG